MRLRSRAALDSGRASSAATPWVSAVAQARGRAAWRAARPVDARLVGICEVALPLFFMAGWFRLAENMQVKLYGEF